MIVSIANTEFKLPDFFIVGAARAGTTTLYAYLDGHPNVFLPKEKEPMFLAVHGQDWSPIDNRTGQKAGYVVDTLSNYVDLFKTAGDGQLIGEASTWYLYYDQTTIRNIKEIYGSKASDVKIIILLRNPAQRAWSHYWLKRRNGEESLSFDQAIQPEVIRERLEKHYTAGFDYLGFGRYYRAVESYLENFPRVKVLLFEEMIEDFPAAFLEISRFLGLAPLADTNAERKWRNVAGPPKNAFFGILARLIYKPSALKSLVKEAAPYRARAGLKYRLAETLFQRERLAAEVEKRLTGLYREDILALARLLGRNLDHWLAPRTKSS